MPAQMEPLWEQLLQYIEERQVIPIVGKDLLQLEVDGRNVRLDDYLARRLTEKLDLKTDLPSNGRSLNDVAGRYLAGGGDIEDVYFNLKTIMPGPEQLPLPETLLKLAGIDPLQLFVTTTFDPLLERAINQTRFGGKEKTQVFAYSPEDAQDIPAELKGLDRPTVFHLLGRLSAVPHYAVTDEDVLEFMHSLQSGIRTPKLLFDELKRQQLLIIGCSFPDWLARFLIRIARGRRLRETAEKIVVADETVEADGGLVHFLERFSRRTTVFPGSATEFVNELHRRWSAGHKPAGAAPGAQSDEIAGLPTMPPGAVFLSYASEDLVAAEAIKTELERVGVDVWFDQDALEAGDAYETKIKRYIGTCSLFFIKEQLGATQNPDPVLSQCFLWIAQYKGQKPINIPPTFRTWTLWQYTDGVHGEEPHRVAGVGLCDRDMFKW